MYNSQRDIHKRKNNNKKNPLSKSHLDAIEQEDQRQRQVGDWGSSQQDNF